MKVLAVQNLWRVIWTGPEGTDHTRLFRSEPEAVAHMLRLKAAGVGKDVQWQREEIKSLALPAFME